MKDNNRLQKEYWGWDETELKNALSQRDPLWSEAVAIGSERYIQDTQETWWESGRSFSDLQ